jgi:hypothetical protein
VFCRIDAEQKAEGQLEQVREDIESHRGGEALGDSLEDGPVVLDAFQTATEKVTHVEPVLFVKRTIQMELFLEGFLDLRSDPWIELSPRIRASRRQRNYEKRDDADEEEQDDTDQETSKDEG